MKIDTHVLHSTICKSWLLCIISWRPSILVQLCILRWIGMCNDREWIIIINLIPKQAAASGVVICLNWIGCNTGNCLGCYSSPPRRLFLEQIFSLQMQELCWHRTDTTVARIKHWSVVHGCPLIMPPPLPSQVLVFSLILILCLYRVFRFIQDAIERDVNKFDCVSFISVSDLIIVSTSHKATDGDMETQKHLTCHRNIYICQQPTTSSMSPLIMFANITSKFSLTFCTFSRFRMTFWTTFNSSRQYKVSWNNIKEMSFRYYFPLIFYERRHGYRLLGKTAAENWWKIVCSLP